MKTLADLQKKVIKEARKTFIEKGADPDGIRDKDVTVIEKGRKLIFTYGDIRWSMPAPSQEAIDSWWEKAGPVIVNGLLLLAAVAVGRWAGSKKD